MCMYIYILCIYIYCVYIHICVYIYMCVYVYIYIVYIYMGIYIYVYIYICIYISMYIYIYIVYIYMYIYICLCVYIYCVYICVYIYMCVNLNICVYIYIQIYNAYVYVQTYIYIYTLMLYTVHPLEHEDVSLGGHPTRILSKWKKAPSGTTNGRVLFRLPPIFQQGLHRRKFRSQTSDNMEGWKSRGGNSQRREESREEKEWERVRRKKMQVEKWRFTVVFQRFVGSQKRRVRSHLARWEMKNCTPLWRQAHLEVKMYKTAQLRSTCKSCDVEKVHAVVARSTFPSQNVQSTPTSEHFWKLTCRKSACRCGAMPMWKSKA